MYCERTAECHIDDRTSLKCLFLIEFGLWLPFVGLKNGPFVFQPLCKPVCSVVYLLLGTFVLRSKQWLCFWDGRIRSRPRREIFSGAIANLSLERAREWSLELWVPLQGSGPSACPGWPSFIPGLHAKSLAILPELPAALLPRRE